MIDDDALADLLATFYDRVREDPLIGPVFNDAVEDWDHHLARIGEFWSSVMFGTGRYKGDPVAKHLALVAKITPAMFDRWLGLWAQTTDALMPRSEAQALQAKAARIGESLQLAIRFRTPSQRAAIADGAR